MIPTVKEVAVESEVRPEPYGAREFFETSIYAQPEMIRAITAVAFYAKAG